MVTQVSLFCQELCGDTQYVIGSLCIDFWCTSPTFCYIEHFVVVHTTHKSHTKHTKPTCPTPKSLPGFAETASSGMRAVTQGPASCVTRLTQSARWWLPRPLLLQCRRWHLRCRQSLRRNASQPAPHTPPGLILDIVGIAAGNWGRRQLGMPLQAARGTWCAAMR